MKRSASSIGSSLLRQGGPGLAAVGLLFLFSCSALVPPPPERSEHSSTAENLEPAATGSTPRNLKDTFERQVLVTVDQTNPSPLRGAGSSHRSYVADEPYARTERTRRLGKRLARDYDLEEAEGWPIGVLGVYCFVFDLPEDADIEALLAELREDDRVESAQRMHHFRTLAASRGDPYAELQRGFAIMRMGEVHRWAAGRGVTIAVIDTGVDRFHEDLGRRIARARDFVGKEASDRVPAERHGTAVAGVIVSTPNNGLGTVGVAPAAEILALRACWEGESPRSDSDDPGSCSSFTLAKALAFMIESKPQILNLSLGGPADPLLERLVRVALDAGVAVVGAYHPSAGPNQFPSSMERVLAVQSLSAASETEHISDLLLAPGLDILTTQPGNSFDFVSGSSFAAAHVSGLLALLLERDPSLDPDRLVEILRDSARPVETEQGARLLVDACAALKAVHPPTQCDPDLSAGSPSRPGIPDSDLQPDPLREGQPS